MPADSGWKSLRLICVRIEERQVITQARGNDFAKGTNKLSAVSLLSAVRRLCRQSNQTAPLSHNTRQTIVMGDEVPLSEQPPPEGQAPPQQPPQKGPALPWLFNRIPPQIWLPAAVVIVLLAIILPIILTLPQNISCAPSVACVASSGTVDFFSHVFSLPRFRSFSFSPPRPLPPLSSPPSLSKNVMLWFFHLLPVKLFPEQTLEIQGISFIIWNGAPPIVTLGSTQLQITGFSGCSRLDVRGENATA